MGKKPKSLNYYFLNKYIHPKAPRGFRENIVALIVNQNEDDKSKYLMVQEKNGAWNFPKKAVKGDNLLEGVLNALVKDIGDELGFKGVVINEKNPQFIQRAILFDFGKQEYDKIRSKAEAKRKRPTKGKIYHLVVVHYNGSSELPIRDNPNVSVQDYRWANEKEVLELARSNLDLTVSDELLSKKSAQFNVSFSEKVISTYTLLDKLSEDLGENGQLSLLQ